MIVSSKSDISIPFYSADGRSYLIFCMTTVTAHDELNIPDFFTELDDDIIAHYGNGPDQKFPGIAEAVTEFNAVIVDFKSREDMS